MATWRWWWQPPALLRPVIVNLKDDPTTAIRGVLWSTRGPWLILRDAALLRSGAPPTAMDGEVLVRADNVSFLQRIQEHPGSPVSRGTNAGGAEA